MANYAYKLDTSDMTVFSDELAQCSDAAWIIDPARNRVLSANASGCARFGWSPEARMPPLVVDAAMPGFVRQRSLISTNNLNTAHNEDLLLWTGIGAERISCRISRLSGTDEPLLLVHEVIGAPAQTKSGNLATTTWAQSPKTKSKKTAIKKPAAKKRDAKKPTPKKSTTAKAPAKPRVASKSKSKATRSKTTPPAKTKRATKTNAKQAKAAPSAQSNVQKQTVRAAAPAEPSVVMTSADRDAAVLQAIAKQIKSGRKSSLPPVPTEPATIAVTPTPPNDNAAAPDFADIEKALKTSVTALREAALLHDVAPRQEDRAFASGANAPISDMTVAGLAKLAHEMRTTLSAISAVAEIMRDERLGTIENPRYRSYAADIHGNAQHVLEVISRMLPIEDNDTAENTSEYTEFDLNALATRALSGLEPLAKERDLDVAIAAAKRLPHIVADATSVRQMIVNLVNNAVKFTPVGGKITIETAYVLNGPVKISVTDTGPGMEQAAIKRARASLEPHKLEQRAGGGFGLGFPVVHQLAAKNGATLGIKSRIGRGTTVTISFGKDRVIPV